MVPYLYKRNVLIYMFKTINGNYDCALYGRMVRNSDNHAVATRNRDNFVLPRYRRVASQSSTRFGG